ncbi:MAG TPA: 2-oxoglutarate and iron-dependent oxygenase domain-containing protein [Candidatus Sulfotelmatobacter sp.]|nr:2-oxoglutarate and iron-dependent oxygenase domain-containing protein [Candidatus Sulfotelmatobacter sp.]
MTAFHHIPLIDIGALGQGRRADDHKIADAIYRASREVGFFYITDHGVSAAVIERAVDAARRFFALSDAAKESVPVDTRHRGYLGFGGAKMYAGAKADLKESFVWGLELAADDPDVRPERTLMGPNQWPAVMPELRTALYAHYEAVLGCGQRLLGAFALALGLPDAFFRDRFDKPLARASIIHYPPQAPDLAGDQFGVAPHTDYGFITILWQDPNGGLEVLNPAREWVAAPPVPGSFVINVGDLLARWSNDRFASTPHRVVNRSGRERYSMPVFFDPDWDAVIDPRDCNLPVDDTPRYPPVVAGEHIRGRFDRAFGYRGRGAPGEADVAFVPPAD